MIIYQTQFDVFINCNTLLKRYIFLKTSVIKSNSTTVQLTIVSSPADLRYGAIWNVSDFPDPVGNTTQKSCLRSSASQIISWCGLNWVIPSVSSTFDAQTGGFDPIAVILKWKYNSFWREIIGFYGDDIIQKWSEGCKLLTAALTKLLPRTRTEYTWVFCLPIMKLRSWC